jgi:hypothetical protein
MVGEALFKENITLESKLVVLENNLRGGGYGSLTTKLLVIALIVGESFVAMLLLLIMLNIIKITLFIFVT